MEMSKETIRKWMGLIAFAIFLFMGIQHFDTVKTVFFGCIHLLFPFILGGAMAFTVNVPMRAIESHLTISKGKRVVSLLLTLVLIVCVVWAVIFLIAPEIGRTFSTIADSVPAFLERTQTFANDIVKAYPGIAQQITTMEFNWAQIYQELLTFLRNVGGNMLTSTLGLASSVLGGVVNSFLALVFALYVLLQKESLGRQGRQLCYAFLPRKKVESLLEVLSLSNGIFSKFLSGQCLEAVILGLMFFVGMSLLRFPYAMMISVLIGVCALVPIFGAFVGCFVGAFLILIVDPLQALWFIVFFLVLQQIEGNLIYPKVVGGSIGLPGIWVLVAVTVGGGTMGIVGMLLFIPLSSVLYALLRRCVKERLLHRKISESVWKN